MALSYSQVATKTISSANTEESMYVVPSGKTVIGQIIVANTSTTNNRKFRLAIVSGGGSAGAADFLAYDVTLTPGETWTVTGITITASDEIRVQSDATSSTAGTGIVYQLYGEIQS